MSVLCRFAEIAARGHFDAPGAATEIRGIQIQFENLIFAQGGFQARRYDHLSDLALIAHVLANEQVLHHLLGDRGTALRPAGSAQIAEEGADDAALIDSMVIEKTAILGGDRRLLQIIGNFG